MTQTADGLIERIAAVRPVLEKNAKQTEADRRVVEENITALREAGAFKVMVPKRYGGYETNVRTKLVRNDTGHAIESAREAIRVLCSAHGASSFSEGSPMQRMWRDSEIASRHAVILPETSALIYGRALMGFTEGISFLV